MEFAQRLWSASVQSNQWVYNYEFNIITLPFCYKILSLRIIRILVAHVLVKPNKKSFKTMEHIKNGLGQNQF